MVVLHGLEGNSKSHYVRGLVAELARRGVPSVVMHQRGCSGEPNLLDRRYHAGNTPDLHEILMTLKRRLSNCWLHVIGYSLGGNVLLKYLGENLQQPLADSAAAVSVPFLLDECAKRLDTGVSKLYRNYLVRQMRAATRAKFRNRSAPIDLSQLSCWRSFYDFDEHVTARLHGFAGADDYYRRCSSRPFLSAITTPTLTLHAADDPFLTSEVLPKRSELGAGINFELSQHGGHVGFISNSPGQRGRYWLELRLCDDAMEKFAAH